MKYTIKRQFSLNNEKFQIISDSKIAYTAKATPSKEYQGQFNIKLSIPFNKHTEDDYCLVEPDPQRSRKYLIYVKNDQSDSKTLFGQLLYKYQRDSHNNYLYTIIIGQKLYKVGSGDLKDRRLAIVDRIHIKQSSFSTYPEILFQAIDSFSKSNTKYHVNIHDKEWQLGYLAIAILLDLHECQRAVD